MVPQGALSGGDLQDICSEINREFVHETPAAVLSLTNLTESGTRYEAAQIAELADIAHKAGLTVHLDGARFANALGLFRLRTSGNELESWGGLHVARFYQERSDGL